VTDVEEGRLKRIVHYRGAVELNMDLTSFPFDVQQVQLHLESISHWRQVRSACSRARHWAVRGQWAVASAVSLLGERCWGRAAYHHRWSGENVLLGRHPVARAHADPTLARKGGLAALGPTPPLCPGAIWHSNGTALRHSPVRSHSVSLLCDPVLIVP
jgi:hypothetical protein